MGKVNQDETNGSMIGRMKARSANWFNASTEQMNALIPKRRFTRSEQADRLDRIIRTTPGVSETVATAMLEVPRHRFVPESMQEYAYVDSALPIGQGQTISQPSLVAVMISLLQIEPGMTAPVLDVGCGSGYTSAILSRIASKVIAVERVESLATECATRLRKLNFKNVEVVSALDDELGYPERAPYDAILVSAGAPNIPNSLTQQLAPNSRLVIPTGDRAAQRVTAVERQGESNDFATTYHQDCRFVPLIGPDAWSDPTV